MLRWIAAVILTVLGPDVATAQGTWQEFAVPETGMRGASVCMPGGGAGGLSHCFHLSCTPGTARRFTVTMTGREMPRGWFYVGVLVDGQRAGGIEMRRTAVAGRVELEGWWNRDQHPRLVAALQAGNRATLAVGQGRFGIDLPLELSGSREALDAVLAACPDLAPTVADPAAHVMSHLETDCAIQGGTVSLRPEARFATEADVDGDGRPDIFVSDDAAQCSAAASLWCGTAGCPLTIFRATDRGYEEIFQSHVRGWNIVAAPDGRPLLEISVHGTSCGGIGADACSRRLGWTGSGLARVD